MTSPLITRQPPIFNHGLAASPTVPILKLYVKGFRTTELQLLGGIVKVSQRRNPRLELLPDDQNLQADVVMIDGLDPLAMEWARGQESLEGKAVIWVDGLETGERHITVKRPVQWTILPVLLARALEQGQRVRVDATMSLPAPAAALSAEPSRGAVLVVDDSYAARTHLRLLLEAKGIRVDDAASGEAAIKAAANNSYACILMDVLMPGIDGYEACRAIKSNRRHGAGPAVVMLTSRTSPFDRIRGRMAGCDAYLTKPVDPQQLYESIARHGGAPPPAAVAFPSRDWPRLDAKAGALSTGRLHGPIAFTHQGTLP